MTSRQNFRGRNNGESDCTRNAIRARVANARPITRLVHNYIIDHPSLNNEINNQTNNNDEINVAMENDTNINVFNDLDKNYRSKLNGRGEYEFPS